MFTFGLDTAVANALVLHRDRLKRDGHDLGKGRAATRTADTVQFRVSIVEGMLAKAAALRKAAAVDGAVAAGRQQRVGRVPDAIMATGPHLPTYVTAKKGMRCAVCYAAGVDRMTHVLCGTCKKAYCVSSERNCYAVAHAHLDTIV